MYDILLYLCLGSQGGNIVSNLKKAQVIAMAPRIPASQGTLYCLSIVIGSCLTLACQRQVDKPAAHLSTAPPISASVRHSVGYVLVTECHHFASVEVYKLRTSLLHRL